MAPQSYLEWTNRNPNFHYPSFNGVILNLVHLGFIQIINPLNGKRCLIKSSDSKHQATDRLPGGLDFDFDFITYPVQTIHQLPFGKIGEIATQQGGQLGLGNTHSLCGGTLG